MFQIGEKVVYPLHGVGIIEAIEKHSVIGQIQTYYVIRLIGTEMKVLVPIQTQAKLRRVIQAQDVERVMDILQKEIVKEIDTNWRTRQNSNLEKMKSGCIFKVAEVVKSLSVLHKEKGLSTGEKRVFDNAVNMIVGEVACAHNIELEQANSIIKRVLMPLSYTC